MFIVIDGPDGSGKTTLGKSLTRQLCQRGIQTVYTREPTSESEWGKAACHMLQGGEVTDVYAFADLFVEDRKEHLANLIQPCLIADKWVVCDRYKYSALAYQQMQGVDPEYLISKNRRFLTPDIIFILLPQNVDILINRVVQRGEATKLFEKKELLATIVSHYRNMTVYFPKENIWYLNADDSVEGNLNQILKVVEAG